MVFVFLGLYSSYGQFLEQLNVASLSGRIVFLHAVLLVVTVILCWANKRWWWWWWLFRCHGNRADTAAGDASSRVNHQGWGRIQSFSLPHRRRVLPAAPAVVRRVPCLSVPSPEPARHGRGHSVAAGARHYPYRCDSDGYTAWITSWFVARLRRNHVQ